MSDRIEHNTQINTEGLKYLVQPPASSFIDDPTTQRLIAEASIPTTPTPLFQTRPHVSSSSSTLLTKHLKKNFKGLLHKIEKEKKQSEDKAEGYFVPDHIFESMIRQAETEWECMKVENDITDELLDEYYELENKYMVP